jgi:hypothetical protein
LIILNPLTGQLVTIDFLNRARPLADLALRSGPNACNMPTAWGGT